jgi:hypothetical protein
MYVQGRDCQIVIKTANKETDIPYSEETIRADISILEENPCIEGDSAYRGISVNSGVVGCVITPPTLIAAPLLFFLAMGDLRLTSFVSGTRNLYRHTLALLPTEGTEPFGIVQNRGGDIKYFPSCKVKAFELRILRDETIKLKLDITGEEPPVLYPYSEVPGTVFGDECFMGENVVYSINGIENTDIYGITLAVKKQGGVKTELWIRRVLTRGADLPETMDEFTITASLLCDKYEERHFGTFHLTLRRLVLKSDETSVECGDSVIGPLHMVPGTVLMEVFTSGEEPIA